MRFSTYKTYHFQKRLKFSLHINYENTVFLTANICIKLLNLFYLNIYLNVSRETSVYHSYIRHRTLFADTELMKDFIDNGFGCPFACQFKQTVDCVLNHYGDCIKRNSKSDSFNRFFYRFICRFCGTSLTLCCKDSL